MGPHTCRWSWLLGPGGIACRPTRRLFSSENSAGAGPSPVSDFRRWYENGVRFKCTQCGGCCSGSPGYVWLSETDIKNAARFLKMFPEDFIRRYTKNVKGNLSLLEKPNENYDCVFLSSDSRKCTIYQARPAQCSTFPYWPAHMDSEEDWLATRALCEGVDHADGRPVSKAQIDAQIARYENNEQLMNEWFKRRHR